MTDLDDWYDPFDDLPPKEEPDCPPCGDGGCRECQPTPLQHWWWRATWRPRAAWWRLRNGWNAVQTTDEAPF